MTVIRTTPPVKVSLDGQLATIDALKQQWQSIPYAANSKQVAEEAKKTLVLFDKPELKKPSILALLPNSAKNYMTIHLIDNMFTTAMEEYLSAFIDATAADYDTFLKPRDTALDFHHAIATGAARFAAKTPDIPIIKLLVGPLLAMIGTLYGVVNQTALIQEKKDEEQSANRTKWFEEVQAKEKQRIQSAVVLIKSRAKAIQRDLEELDSKVVNDALVDELKALDLFVIYLSPNKPIKLNDKLVQDYLLEYKK